MRLYWVEHSETATMESMLLDDKAEEIILPDKNEVLSLLPDA